MKHYRIALTTRTRGTRKINSMFVPEPEVLNAVASALAVPGCKSATVRPISKVVYDRGLKSQGSEGS